MSYIKFPSKDIADNAATVGKGSAEDPLKKKLLKLLKILNTNNNILIYCPTCDKFVLLVWSDNNLQFTISCIDHNGNNFTIYHDEINNIIINKYNTQFFTLYKLYDVKNKINCYVLYNILFTSVSRSNRSFYKPNFTLHKNNKLNNWIKLINNDNDYLCSINIHNSNINHGDFRSCSLCKSHNKLRCRKDAYYKWTCNNKNCNKELRFKISRN